ncbi:Acyl-CoA dehydrogenase fadE12 [Brevundimonas diminuta]|uniref:acyl-CoA dehydrogenase n=1 Tax=Brevundimonas diminuta TaxID=293 RepID=UPI000311EB46|nr:acyl-CoA dehydrogenase [Brevundimonas diminuta]OWR24550.1 acyl-CoA dehydrogenase [Brevundimonas diminuta]WQE46413.1 acyl-CoA dehydrogenase [Brevundimonas diminuta]SPU48127.1 Acyl-CoA dehydrogenase fadE12 [Brevundimonas diminuta]SUW15668.1 Acyl-CoA dehydrogenase fadE12 [Brevundimonas diminuta]
MWIWIVSGAAVAALLVLLLIRPVRLILLSRPVMSVFRRIMPRMSATEQAAIESGNVWWDAELFSGRPDWKRLLATPAPRLTDEEQTFLDVETERLCDLSNDWDSTAVWQDLSPEAWAYARDKGFLGMIIPRAYGGLGFSAYAHSQVIQKLSTRCSAAAVSVMVPNSLGPAELLLHYGTEEQKNHYLPRLARGEEIPCFALTNPFAGSDAASITDTGVVCKAMWKGRETLGFRITWRKRYITLAPIATVIGLAFRAVDPDGLLDQGDEPGITCVLIPREHPGVRIGRRHWPLNAVFQNGPIEGDDVFVPMEMIIGGREQVGAGWRMLMECLAAGRAISLPSSNVGMSKLAVGMVGAYVAIRRQFNQPIGAFEGVQEALARMAGHLYATDSVRRLAAAALDQGEKPSVVSAIAKYHVTERARIIVNDGMDVIGGKGVCMGPGNFLARAYQQIPVAITVEGANIMTRTLIIYGQGAIRCHPYVLPMMRAAEVQDLKAFDRALFGYVGFVRGNMARAIGFSLTGGALITAPRDAAPELRRYYRQATRLSTLLALASDVSMAMVGGALKRKGALTGRLGDMLSQLFILSAALKRFEDEGRPAEDLPFIHWAAQDALSRATTAWRDLLANHPSRGAALFLKLAGAPFGLKAPTPGDKCAAEVAGLIQRHGPARDRLVAGSWSASLEVDPIAAVLVAFDLYPQVEAVEARLKSAIRTGRLSRAPQDLTRLADWAREAETQGLIDADESVLIARYAEVAIQAIMVDDFPQDFGLAEGLARREVASDRPGTTGKGRQAA